MIPTNRPARTLGTMVVHGFPRSPIDVDLGIARRIGAEVVEVLPEWSALPDPAELGRRIVDAGLRVHSAHGCWGGQSIRASRVDLGSTTLAVFQASLDDLKTCLDWLNKAGGTVLVVHPGGLSDVQEQEARKGRLAEGLVLLADHAKPMGLRIAVENMPPGVHPGSRMADLTALVAEIGRPELGLALDTGHANLVASAASETLDAATGLVTTHVHDNNGRQDSHLPPGMGSVVWEDWLGSLDRIGYVGPIVLECIRHLRQHPESIDERFLDWVRRITRADGW